MCGLLFVFSEKMKEVTNMLSKPMDSIGFVNQFDPELAAMMDREFSRQKDSLGKGKLCQHHTFRTQEAPSQILPKPEMEVMAARSSWRSMSLSYSTITSPQRTCSSA